MKKAKPKPMKFYHYSQNNSGGHFTYDKKAGITHHVIIEASSPSDADARAEKIGLYFDGCEKEMDCDCCGDRWSRTYSKGDEVPSIYSKPVTEPLSSIMGKWIEGYEAFVHYANGEVKGFYPEVKKERL